MTNDNIILTGFMGTGKTTVGKILADQLGYLFVDTDALIVEKDGRSIPRIFEEDGEQAFRALEKSIAFDLVERRGLVIATGGRLMLDPQNARLLEPTGRVFCLSAEPKEIMSRLKSQPGSRPLLDEPNPIQRVRQLLKARKEGYDRYFQISTDDKTAQQVVEIIKFVMNQTILPVTHPEGKYDVFIGQDLLTHARQLLNLSGYIAVITDSHVAPLYAGASTMDTEVITFPAGEKNKTLATVNRLYNELLARQFDRHGTIFALGGGVVGDVAGFVAATYMRGVDVVQCPTTLLAMVDASVGGKTGVDLPQGKNLVGAFKQPIGVLIDLSTLTTLPQAEFNSGMAEVVKAGLIGDANLFKLLEENALRLPGENQDFKKLEAAIVAAIKVKRDIVQEDPFEKGRRAVLNLGHTFGHAIEQLSGYALRHGEAVSIGMVAAAYLSVDLGFCESGLPGRIEKVLTGLALPVRIPKSFASIDIYRMMSTDKKKAGKQLRFVLLRSVADVFVTGDVPEEAVLATLKRCGAG